MRERLIVALDVPSTDQARQLVETLSPYVGYFKIGLELITAEGAPAVVKMIHSLGGRVFLDAKFNDIPNTVAGAARSAAQLGVALFDVHASSGVEALRAAVKNRGSAQVLAVTVLTSLDDAQAKHLFGASSSDKVVQFALDARMAGANGIVCSPQELEILSRLGELKSMLKVTPGIRPDWAGTDDQKRFLTPSAAIKAGATHLVIGRPITSPPAEIGSPVEAAKRILEELERGAP